MSLKRKYTITFGHPNGNQTVHEQEAECMKTLDCAVILMDWDDAGCKYKEVGFYRYEAGSPITISSVDV